MRYLIGAGLAAVCTVSGCSSTDSGRHSGAGICRPNAASALVGQPAPENADILHRTRGTIVRRLAPGDGATKDYRLERVTVTVDGGMIVAAACG